ncbi:MAG: exonuclease domain-containing protein [Neisseria sp.]|nr:exonuclease domain-containing protein [Neisseria sp.]
MSSIPHYPALSELFSYFKQPVVLLDLESTGGHFTDDRITEIAFLRFENGRTERFECLVNPGIPIPKFITRLTGIDDAMVGNAPDFSQLSDRLLSLLQGAVLVAHNSKFDYQFLQYAFQRCGLHFAAKTLCTVQLSRRLYPQFRKHSLESIIERHGISVSSRHRAWSDVAALADFLERCIDTCGMEAVVSQCRRLLQPQPFPEYLPEHLDSRLHQLPDSDGITLWFDDKENLVRIAAHRYAFRETSALLADEKSDLRLCTEMVFQKTIGPLDSLTHIIRARQKYRIAPQHTAYFSVHFIEENGILRARIVQLADGLQSIPSYGLFPNKKAAKRALLEWAKTYGLCPKMLDILPYSLPAHSPCPSAESGKNCLCSSAQGRAKQYCDTQQFAEQLPVIGWGKLRHLQIEEHEAVCNLTKQYRLRNGLLELNGNLYFDAALPAVLKEYLKTKYRHPL